MPVTIENLSTLADTTRVRTRGSGLPHADVHFDFNGAAATFDMDNWMNRHDPTWANYTAALAAQVIPRDNAIGTVAAWRCNRSLFEDLCRGLYFQNQAANWRDPGGGAATHDIALHQNAAGALGTAQQQTTFMLLVTGAVAAYYRESTMAALNVVNVHVTHPNPVAVHLPQTTQVALNWDNVIKEARKIAKAKIDGRIAPPNYAAPHHTNTYDTAMYDAAVAANGGFTKLITDYTVLRRGHGGNGYTFWHSNTTFIGAAANLRNGVEGDIGTALNHIRFVLYAEWRIGYELTTGNAA